MVSSTLPGPSGFGSAELRKKSQSASENVPIHEAWLRSKELNASIIDHLFEQLDKDKNGTLSRIEVIKSLRSNEEVQALLRLPGRIRQEDGTRDAFESVFQAIDRDDSKSISRAEWHRYCLGAGEAEAPLSPELSQELFGSVVRRRGTHAELLAVIAADKVAAPRQSVVCELL